ncbi:MAG: AAA family ATPase [Thiotrichaceae bacterium]
MRILRLYIQGCGVFKSNLIDFTHNDEPQNLICLAGVNGSGKTTVMELVFSLISFLDSNFQGRFIADRLKPHVLTRTEFAQLDILIDEEELSIIWGDFDKKQGNCVQYLIITPRLSHSSTIQRNLFGISTTRERSLMRTPLLRRSRAGRVSSRIIYHIEKDSLQSLLKDMSANNSVMNTTSPEVDPLPSIYFFNAHDREINYIPYNYDDAQLVLENPQKYQLAGKYHPSEDDLKRVLIFYEYAYPTEFEKLKSWINEHVLVDKSIEGIDRPNFEVIVRTQNGTTHGLELLSSGEESLLIVAIQCFLRASKNVVFMIDEVDQSLHPEFQEKMMMLLTQLQKDTDCQIIVSSHSEIIWRMFDSQGLIDLTSVVMS